MSDESQRSEQVDTPPRVACANCGASGDGPWCSACGQEYPTPRGAVERVALRQWVRIRHTVAALALHPGLLTAEFRDGKRARSINPWRFAFNVMALFLALSFVTDFKVANFPKSDPSGGLGEMVAEAVRSTNLDTAVLMERTERRFNTIFTLMLTLVIAATALIARVTHWRGGYAWSVHFVFALHLTAWGLILSTLYIALLRWTGTAGFLTSTDAHAREGGAAILATLVVWQFCYVTIALRRVYADSWAGAAAKAALMTALRLLGSNVAVTWSFVLALQSVRIF